MKSVLLLQALLLGGCQTFLAVETGGGKTVFRWRDNAPVAGLTVLADADCGEVQGKAPADRVWWQISGDIKPPVTYGALPPGATEMQRPRSLSRDCSPYTVTVTDQAFRGESSRFRP